MISARLEARFIDGAQGPLFVTLRRPLAQLAPAVLVAPPFGDEMNKSRKMITDVAQALATRGVATVIVDPFGTGDSAGEFREADWDGWVEDLLGAASWAAGEGLRVSGLLGIRLGALLAAAVAARLPGPVARTVFWQPVTDGERFMTQFLRMRVAASLMEDRKESVGGLRAASRHGEVVEVAGYEIPPKLLAQIDGGRLEDIATAALGSLEWLVLARAEGEALAGASRDCIEKLRMRLPAVSAASVVGEPFWTSTEVVRIPALVERTVAVLGVRE